MPTIQIKMKDLENLLGRSVTISELADRLPLVKGEIKGYDKTSGELKLELNDTNRPDLWCVEGVARQIKTHRLKTAVPYPFYNGKRKAAAVIEAAPSLKMIRPYIGACIARGLTIDNETLVQLIQTQEKLSESFGRKRLLVSIGLYRLAKIVFPVTYKTVRPDEVRFVPLGFESPMTLRTILEKHPKGMAYAGILSKAAEYPLLVDRENKILSFPPIINSREVGEVQVGDRDLFVEVTGTDLRMVILTVNILAANLADRGAEITPVEVRYPYLTDFGRKVVMPLVLSKPMTVPLHDFRSALGEPVKMTGAVSVLKAYGYDAKARGRNLTVSVPAYRDDLLHPVDVVEDFAISRGYESFVPEMPSEFTVGGLSSIEQFSDRVRESVIGMGFQEVISNILTNPDESVARMNLPASSGYGDLVTVENVMSQTYSALRNGIIPSLLRVEAVSSKSFYPHRIFEAGETAITDAKSPEGTRTVLKLAALIAHPAANFSELHSGLDLLMYYLGRAYQLEPVVHPSFLDGRVGKIVVEGRNVGLTGELHPQVLENWQIAMPCAVFELSLDDLVL
ncbi:MAG: phenylalanine--tRNA ligase subunit beta [Nitrospirae bacterium]|nr:phenylalanine--tRNA ligase subunit beta [Nitrospirota bacterium]